MSSLLPRCAGGGGGGAVLLGDHPVRLQVPGQQPRPVGLHLQPRHPHQGRAPVLPQVTESVVFDPGFHTLHRAAHSNLFGFMEMVFLCTFLCTNIPRRLILKGSSDVQHLI